MAPHVFGPLWCVAWFGTRHRHPKVRSTPRRPLSRISPEFALPARHSLLLPAHACTYTSTHCRPVHDDPRMPAPCPASVELHISVVCAQDIHLRARESTRWSSTSTSKVRFRPALPTHQSARTIARFPWVHTHAVWRVCPNPRGFTRVCLCARRMSHLLSRLCPLRACCL